MSLEAGRLPHFRIVDPLGEAGMCGAWKAVDTTLDRGSPLPSHIRGER